MNENTSKPVNEKSIEKKSDLPYGYKMSREVGEKVFESMCHDLGLDEIPFKKRKGKDVDTKNKLVHAFCTGFLEYENALFTVCLRSPIKIGPTKELSVLKIPEPTGAQLRSITEVENEDDNVGKALAVLGDVTKLGLPVMNKLKSRDSMVAVSVVSLFL